MKTLYLCILLMCLSGIAHGASPIVTGRYDIKTITPGKEYKLLILAQSAPGVPSDTWGRFYIATINSNPPLVDELYARFYVETSATSPGGFQLRLTSEQTTALAGKNGRWQLLMVPDTGGAQLLGFGSVEVKKP